MPPPHDDPSPPQYHEDRNRGDESTEDEFYHGPYSLEPFERDQGDGGASGGPAAGDLLMTVTQFIVLTVFLTAFVMVLTISITVMMKGPSTDLTYAISPFFWLALSLLMFFLFYLTRGWPGKKRGEAARLTPAPAAGANLESDVYRV